MTQSGAGAAADALVLIAAAKGLLVDLDGTLVDSSAPVRRVWTAFAHRHGLDSEYVLRFAQGRPSRETVTLLAPDSDHEAEAAAVEDGEVNDPEGVRPIPGALDLLTGDRRLAIVTSCSEALATARLRAAALPIPAILVTSDQVQRGKPDPACFEIGARRLSLEPEQCLVIEDAPAGITAGRASGARVIAVRTTHPDDDLRDADAIVEDLSVIVGQLPPGHPR